MVHQLFSVMFKIGYGCTLMIIVNTVGIWTRLRDYADIPIWLISIIDIILSGMFSNNSALFKSIMLDCLNPKDFVSTFIFCDTYVQSYTWEKGNMKNTFVVCLNIIFVSSRMYPCREPQRDPRLHEHVIWYISDNARDRTHIQLRPKCVPTPLGPQFSMKLITVVR